MAAIHSSNQTKQVVKTLTDWTLKEPEELTASRRIHLHFLHKPVAVLGEDRVDGPAHRAHRAHRRRLRGRHRPDARLARRRPSTARSATSAPRCSGSRSTTSRASSPTTRAASTTPTASTVPGVYTTGWIKRGPVGPHRAHQVRRHRDHPAPRRGRRRAGPGAASATAADAATLRSAASARRVVRLGAAGRPRAVPRCPPGPGQVARALRARAWADAPRPRQSDRTSRPARARWCGAFGSRHAGESHLNPPHDGVARAEPPHTALAHPHPPPGRRPAAPQPECGGGTRACGRSLRVAEHLGGRAALVHAALVQEARPRRRPARANAISCVATSMVMPSALSSRSSVEHLADQLGVERAGDLVEQHQRRACRRGRGRSRRAAAGRRTARRGRPAPWRPARRARASPAPRPRPPRAGRCAPAAARASRCRARAGAGTGCRPGTPCPIRARTASASSRGSVMSCALELDHAVVDVLEQVDAPQQGRLAGARTPR